MVLRAELLHSKLLTLAKALRSLTLESISTIELNACSRTIFAEWVKSLLQYQTAVIVSCRLLNHAALICPSSVHLREKPGLHSARHHVTCQWVLVSHPSALWCNKSMLITFPLLMQLLQVFKRLPSSSPRLRNHLVSEVFFSGRNPGGGVTERM